VVEEPDVIVGGAYGDGEILAVGRYYRLGIEMRVK
jgi:hypothetical protein